MLKTVSQLPPESIGQYLCHQGLGIQSGPFHVLIRSTIPAIHQGIQILYKDFPVIDRSQFFDFHVCVKQPNTIRRWWRPKIFFTIDGKKPFKPLPKAHALPVLEWGLNWSIANQAHQYLMLHAAVVERQGFCCILPGPPGSGKSTLCAALVARGWRLLSDEMALIDLETGLLAANPRPISLKNRSIGIIRDYWPEAVIGPKATGTDKGTVAHVAPPLTSVQQQLEPAAPCQIVFPKYQPDAVVTLSPITKAPAMMRLAESCFNHHGLGKAGFIALTELLDRSQCHSLHYSRLDDGIAALAQLGGLPA